MYGSHCVKTYSSTQAVIALSSAEAEYYGLIKAASCALGMQAMYHDLGESISIDLFTDASAARGIAMRSGLGKLRHMSVRTLWLQERIRNKEIALHKVKGTVNVSDLQTKYLSSDIMRRHMQFLSFRVEPGRAQACPELS